MGLLTRITEIYFLRRRKKVEIVKPSPAKFTYHDAAEAILNYLSIELSAIL